MELLGVNKQTLDARIRYPQWLPKSLDLHAVAPQVAPMEAPAASAAEGAALPGTPQQAFRNQPETGAEASLSAEVGPYPRAPASEPEIPEYGPVRTRVRGKASAEALLRPHAMLQDDFAEMMEESSQD